jgi:glycosyltransferase involved in cell wall biosynthesis
MARIAYIDHSYHKKTLSTDFLPNILRERGHAVDYFWDESWAGGEGIPWEAVVGYDVVIMFQSQAKICGGYYCSLHPNTIFIPMLDQFGVWKGPLFNLQAFWEPFQGSKVISFSTAVHGMAVGSGIRSYYARYYQKTDTATNSGEASEVSQKKGLRGFFWLRRESDLPWQVIRKLIDHTEFENFHIHLAHDPGSPSPTLPSEEEVARFNITTSTWFEDKAEYNALLQRADVFFVPRMEEGIGQSFLEALSRGQCVVAPDHGTMNEYILTGLNGFLFDPKDPRPLDFSCAHQLGRNARLAAQAGRAAWEENEDKLVNFILAPSAELYADRYQHAFQASSSPRQLQAKVRYLTDRLPLVRRMKPFFRSVIAVTGKFR